MARFLSIALLSFCCILTAQADIFSASNALSRGDYETAVKEFTRLAEKGDANAQANLGYMYYAGEGVPQSFENAVFWYRKAATQGNKDAQYNLAVSYAFGEGTKQDLTEAAIWYRRAGEQGHVVSQYSLAISYAYGEGVPQDQTEAARWFKKAAELGYARAQVNLGSMYHTGEGLEQDYEEAARWYRLAADRGDATAQYNLGTMYRSGKGLEQNYAQAKRWFRQSADQGYAAAQNELVSLERSAAANVATRTIQAKPKLQAVKKQTPEPEVTQSKKATTTPNPVEEKIAIQNNQLKETGQSTTQNTDNQKKKALFSVDKEGLLSLDQSELDIAESKPVSKPETKTTESKKEPSLQVEKTVAKSISEEKVSAEVADAVDEVETTTGGSAGKSTWEWEVGDKKAPSEYDNSETFGGFFSAIGRAFSSDDNNDEPEIETAYIDNTTSTKEHNEQLVIDKAKLETEEALVKKQAEAKFEAEETLAKEQAEAKFEAEEALAKKQAEADAKIAVEEAKAKEKVSAEVADAVDEVETTTGGSAGKSTWEWEVGDKKASSEYDNSETFGGFFSAIGRAFSSDDNNDEPEIETAYIDNTTSTKEHNEQLAIDKAKLEAEEALAKEQAEAKAKFEAEEALAKKQAEADAKIAVEEAKAKEKALAKEQSEENAAAGSAGKSTWNVDNKKAPSVYDANAPTEGFFEAIGRVFSIGDSDESEIETVYIDNTASTLEREKQQTIVEPTASEQVIEPIEETTNIAEFKEESNPIEAVEKENNTAVSSTKTEPSAIHRALGLPTPNNKPVSSTTLFDSLFPSEEKNETNSALTEKEDPVETTEVDKPAAESEEVVADVTETEEIMAEEPVVANNNWGTSTAETVEEAEPETKPTKGFFSSIGDFFSGKNETENTLSEETAVENNAEEVIIAKVEEPVSVIEASELTQESENDLSQYSIEAGRRALTNNDYDEALKQFNPLANAGNSEAQSYLGSLYYVGKGVTKNLTEAYNWYKKSADQGNEDAQYSIGNMYLLGEGVEQNNTNARKWYTMASEQGHIAAKNNLVSLKKLESLNHENQLKLDALAAEQKRQEELDSIPVEEPEIVNNEEKNPELLGLSSELIESDSTKNDSVQETSLPEVVELEVPEIKTDTETVKKTVSIESSSNEAPETNSLDEETEDTNNIASTDESQAAEKTPSFFNSLFGSNDAVTTNETDSAKPEVTKEIQNNDVDLAESEKVAMLETELAIETEQTLVDVDEIIVETSTVSEVETLRPLAIQGDQEAQYKLGSLYYSGNSVKQDYSQAALWYRRAAQQGNVDAQYSLGNMSLMGEGITQNNSEAVRWYTLAAEQGHDSAKHNLENLQKTQSNNSDKLISLDNTTESTAASKESGKLEYEQGLAYAFGDGVAQNDRTAFNLFYESAEKGYVLAQYKLGVAFSYGEGVRQDQKKAAEWYRKSAEQGYTIAQRNLATMYLDGKGVEKNKVHALAWYQVVAKAGNAMDLRRRDMLKSQLSDVEILESQELTKQISNLLATPPL